jgi:hypothetical protein
VPQGNPATSADVAAPAGGDLLGDPQQERENLFVPLPRNPTAADWEFWRRQIDALIEEGKNRAGIKLDNESAIGRYQKHDRDAYDGLMEAIHRA